MLYRPMLLPTGTYAPRSLPNISSLIHSQILLCLFRVTPHGLIHVHCTLQLYTSISFFFKGIYLFLEREEGRVKKMGRNIHVWLPLVCPPTGELTRIPSMCPEWELNQRPFGSQAGTQSTEPHQPGHECSSFKGDFAFSFANAKEGVRGKSPPDYL